MNKQRLQELAGVNELKIKIPKIFTITKIGDEYEIKYNKYAYHDLYAYYGERDSHTSFSSELDDLTYDELDIIETYESLEEIGAYLLREGFSNADEVIDQYILLRDDLDKYNIPYRIMFEGDDGIVYIFLEININDIEKYFK